MKSTQNVDCYIVGTSYTGSTILGAALNSHPQMAYIGEFARIPAYQKTYGHNKFPAGCLHCLIENKECELFSEKKLTQLGSNSPSESIDYLRKRIKKPIIIDGSKYVEWLKISCKDHKRIQDVRVIILTKRPHDYLKSCLSRDIEPLWAEANAWRDTYFDAMRTVNRLGVSSLVVHCEDYIEEPAKVLQQICAYLGVGYDKRMLEPSKAQLHAIGGNPGAYMGSFDKKVLSERANTIGQKEFDINPARLKSKILTKLQKVRQSQKLRQIAFETPGLIDVATQLGYTYKDF